MSNIPPRVASSHLIPSHQSRPSDDPIFALNREATERAKKGESIVNATVGALLDDSGKLAILPTAARAVHEVPAIEWATYAPIAGSPEFLRAVIQDLLATRPELADAATAVATPGGSGALRHAVGNFLEPGQALLTSSYFWGPYQTISDESDRKVETFRMFGDDGALDVAALDEKVGALLASQGRVLLFLNDPCHNPTGYSMRPEEWRHVSECLLRHAQSGPVTLLVDIAYAAYGAGTGREFLDEVASLSGKVGLLFAWSASKAFTHYGLRVGALVGCFPEEKERRAVEAALSYSSRGTWSNCTRGGLYAVTRLLTEPDLVASCNREREGLRTVLRQRVDAFNRAAKEKGLRYPRYEGGFFVTVFCAGNAQEKAAAMRERGVYVVPTQGALRVGLCSVAEKDVPRLVEALA